MLILSWLREPDTDPYDGVGDFWGWIMLQRRGSDLAAVVGILLVGCAGADENIGTDLGTENLGFDIEQMRFTCGEATRVGDASDIFAQLPDNWPIFCGVSSDPPPLTVDLRVDAPMELDATKYSGPANCDLNEANTSCNGPVFVVRSDVEGGANVIEQTNVGGRLSATKVELQPGTYRLEARMVWEHPSLYLEAQIVIWSACSADCPEGSIPCKTDQKCYYRSSDPGYEDFEYCSSCLRRPAKECACWTLDGPRADGWNCQLSLQPCGDIGVVGKCEAGVCR